MIVTREEQALLRSSFDRLQAQVRPGHSFGQAFYSRVFARLPEARTMFGDDLEGQGMKFLGTLRMVADAAENPASLDPMIERLATGHAALGIEPAHYPPMGEALVETLVEASEEGLSEEEAAAWRRAFTALAERMTAAATPV